MSCEERWIKIYLLKTRISFVRRFDRGYCRAVSRANRHANSRTFPAAMIRPISFQRLVVSLAYGHASWPVRFPRQVPCCRSTGYHIR